MKFSRKTIEIDDLTMKAKKDGVYKVAKVALAQKAADGIVDVAKEKADGFNEYDSEE